MEMEVKSRPCTILPHDHPVVDHDEIVFNNSQKKKKKKKPPSGVLMKREVDNTVLVHVHWKGEAEAILEMCSSFYDIFGNIKDLDDRQKEEFRRIIQHMVDRNLQCIAFAQKQVDELVDGHQTLLLEEKGPVLLALVGINDPCRPEMREAVKDCRNSGVDVKIITGDDVSEAKDIGRECGILLHTDDDEDGAVITGEAFRNYSQKEREEKVDKIKVMANSSPDHKLLLVKTLKKRDRIVAVSGNSTNDVLVLLEADLGIYRGNPRHQ